ncbi:MAG: ribonuclease PH [Anaerolineaceae bacterium]|nr:ribonuclease PH [Anaerolineaceae bacterium]
MTNGFARPDGRKFDELRPLAFTPDYVSVAEGSVLVTWGETRVLCNLTVQNGVKPWMAGKGTGWITAEYALLPRSTLTRTPRETQGLKGRTQEIRRLIGRSLRMAVDLDLIGERTLLLDCDVLQADGGTRVASITGGYLALALGLRPLIASGAIPAAALRPPIAAVSVGMLEGNAVLDLNYAEDSLADVDLNVVMTHDGRFIEVQGTAEGEPFTENQLQSMLSLARKGIGEIQARQQSLLDSLD